MVDMRVEGDDFVGNTINYPVSNENNIIFISTSDVFDDFIISVIQQSTKESKESLYLFF